MGENGLPGNMSSEKKVLIEVGDSLSDDGGDGESAVDPLPPIIPPAGRVNLPRCMLLLLLTAGGGGELLRASSALWTKWQRGP